MSIIKTKHHLEKLRIIGTTVFALTLLFSIVACNRPANIKNTLAHGTIKKIERDGYSIIVEYKDGRKLIQQRTKLMAEMNLAQEQIDTFTAQLREQMKQQYLFSVTVLMDKEKGDFVLRNNTLQDYSKNLRELLFALGDKVYLKDKDGNTVYPSVYNMDRTFGLTNDHAVLFTFPRYDNEGKTLLKKNRIEFIIDGFGPIAHKEVFPFTLRG